MAAAGAAGLPKSPFPNRPPAGGCVVLVVDCALDGGSAGLLNPNRPPDGAAGALGAVVDAVSESVMYK